MNDREEWRERVSDIRAGGTIDDDDDDIKANIGNMQRKSKSRLCDDKDETVDQMISECRKPLGRWHTANFESD